MEVISTSSLKIRANIELRGYLYRVLAYELPSGEGGGIVLQVTGCAVR